MTRGPRVIVLGYIVRGPLGGMAWHHLQYVLGLRQLGCDAYFFEDSQDYPACYNPLDHTTTIDPTYGLEFARDTFARLGIGAVWAYWDAHAGRWYGPASEQALSLCRSADVLLNVSGVNPMRPWFRSIPSRIFIDTDPLFTQIRHLSDAASRKLAAEHTGFFTFGEDLTLSGRGQPDDGFRWQATRQPVVLEQWPFEPGPPAGKITTVMQWDSYPAVEYGGKRFGMKSESFAPYSQLPLYTGEQLELALGSVTAPREQLQAQGWSINDPLVVTRDPWTYQSYLQHSKAEFSVAKHGYVEAATGWFSERSACYLASGRPVVVQDTGFGDRFGEASGVFPFSTPEQALEGIRRACSDYRKQCAAARQAAQEFFDSRKVLKQLLDRIV